MKRLVVPAALLLLVASLPTAAHAADLTTICRGDLPVRPGQTLTWRALPSGGSGDFSYVWSGDVSGTARVESEVYTAIGPKVATVVVTDDVTGQQVQASCLMHVMPNSFVEPPSVTPVLWVPRGVDPTPIAPRLQRAWRFVRTIFLEQYGKTFRMRPLVTIASPLSERDICGGDCSDRNMSNVLMDRAQADADSAIGGVIPYTRTFLVSAWGAGGFAGAYSWDLGRGGVGDWALAPTVGRKVPPLPPDVLEGFLNDIGKYLPAVGTIAHELNHLIAWDDPHDYSIFTMPNAYERAVSLAGPFLTQTTPDTVDPTVAFVRPPGRSTISGTTPVEVSASDAAGIDAVQFLVDGHPWALDTTPPFRIGFDSTLVGHGEHQLEAMAFDPTGNATRVERTVFVENVLPVNTCPTGFPTGTFHACFYDGLDTSAPFLGAVLDHPFPVPSSNVGFGPLHLWGADEIAFDRFDHVTGVWRGTLELRPGTYLFRFFADDGIRVRVDGVTIVDALVDQVATYDRVVQVDGSVRVLIRWYENEGSQELVFRWWPTAG